MDECSSPLTDDDTVDAVGVLKGGGLDLVILVGGPIGSNPAILKKLENKIRNYVNAAKSTKFLYHYKQNPGAPIVIYISCAYPIADAALATIEKMKNICATSGIGLELRKQMGDVH